MHRISIHFLIIIPFFIFFVVNKLETFVKNGVQRKEVEIMCDVLVNVC